MLFIGIDIIILYSKKPIGAKQRTNNWEERK